MPTFKFSILLKGCTIQDLDDPLGIDVEIPIMHVIPRRIRIGQAEELADAELWTPTKARPVYEVIPDGPVTTIAAPDAETAQFDYGRYILLETVLLGCDEDGEELYPYVYLMATYRDGSDHEAGELRRAAVHATDEVGTDTYWTGKLPRLVVLDGDQLDIQPGENNGEYELASFRLMGRFPNG